MARPLKIAVFTAVSFERKIISRSLAGGPFEAQTEIFTTGMGLRAARGVAQKILHSSHYGAVLVLGMCGSLVPGFCVGDIAVINEVMSEQGLLRSCDEGPTQKIKAELTAAQKRAKTGRLSSVDRIVVSRAERLDHFSKTGAVVVDMETAVILEETQKLEKSERPIFVAVRAVMDDLQTGIVDFNMFMNSDQSLEKNQLREYFKDHPDEQKIFMEAREQAARSLFEATPYVVASVFDTLKSLR